MPSSHQISRKTRERVFDTFIELGGVNVTLAELAEKTGYHKTVVGTVMRGAVSEGRATRSIDLTRRSTGGRRPLIYTATVFDGGIPGTDSVKVDVTVPQEVISKPEPEEVYETVGNVNFRKNSTAHKVARRLVTTVRVGGRFTVNGLLDSFARNATPPTRGSVHAAVDKLVKAGYVEKTEHKRHYSDGRPAVSYYRLVKTIPFKNAPTVNTDVDLIATLAKTVTTATPAAAVTPSLGLATQIESLIKQRNELDADLTRLTDELANTSAARTSVLQELEACKTMLLDL